MMLNKKTIFLLFFTHLNCSIIFGQTKTDAIIEKIENPTITDRFDEAFLNELKLNRTYAAGFKEQLAEAVTVRTKKFNNSKKLIKMWEKEIDTAALCCILGPIIALNPITIAFALGTATTSALVSAGKAVWQINETRNLKMLSESEDDHLEDFNSKK